MKEVRACCAIFVLLVGATEVFCAISSEAESNSITRAFDAKGMLTSIASDLMSRGFAGLTGSTGAGTSQVVSLNVTNLVVLVLLKALIFAAGSLGAGAWKGGYARSLDGEEKLFTDEELLFFLSYLTGKPNDNGCLQNIACLQPQQARKYAAAGKMLLKTASTMSIHADPTYDQVLQELQEAASWGSVGGDCKRYSCGLKENPKNAKN
ncbi:hypothetical protein PPYR_08052 [Photinus pyralis]|uniref:Uncharacterized protein n=1 Tax=Photinus pyralis TaxID=7054 RepID=A0A5N4AS40_PHOPY|nr:uncharacterized protein LOC116168832 [Photinus pyralis]KAB0800172.1 hypothetical protein PPYR_08052 [Photinus pyralis]